MRRYENAGLYIHSKVRFYSAVHNYLTKEYIEMDEHYPCTLSFDVFTVTVKIALFWGMMTSCGSCKNPCTRLIIMRITILNPVHKYLCTIEQVIFVKKRESDYLTLVPFVQST